jgi:hypothetical protein
LAKGNTDFEAEIRQLRDEMAVGDEIKWLPRKRTPTSEQEMGVEKRHAEVRDAEIGLQTAFKARAIELMGM